MVKKSFPVQTKTYLYEKNGTTLYYPQIIYNNRSIQRKVNEQIEQSVLYLMKQQEKLQDVQHFDQMIGLYEIKTNERNVLSITLSNYAIHKHFAHGLTILSSLNIDMQTGKDIPFHELFKADSNYKKTLEHIIKLQIKERNLPTLTTDVTVSSNQDYYIADKALVIYYQLYAITPYYVGLPMFPISVFKLEDYFKGNSIITRMLP